MPIGKGNIFMDWLQVSPYIWQSSNEKTMSFTLTVPITSQPHTLTYASQYIHLTASHPHTSQYIFHCLTHSHPRTCISVHSPSHHTLTHLANWWLCIAASHPSHNTLQIHTVQPANQPSRNSVTCSCRLQVHTLPTHTLHTLTPSHSRVAMKVWYYNTWWLIIPS